MSSKKVSVTLTYVSSGAQPPVFLAGSFSEPAWHPQEMEFTTDENGELHFYKEVKVDEGGEFQYKFRIGHGDWWELNEQAPTITDELGNRNNLLLVPTVEQIIQKPTASEPVTAPVVSDTAIPEVVVEKVDDQPRHGDDFGPNATTGQKDAHDMRALDAEPDHVKIRSQTTTPTYANTAAEVADSAAMLDRESSPAPVSDEAAGRTGERRLSETPIPQVALTAAEVADIAAILDQEDEDSFDDLKMNLPKIHYQYDTPSGPGTPWHEQAPLFAHELVGSHEVEIESPITSESLESPTKPGPEEEVIDLNDPTLERFPEDRMSILTHIRSCESRMSEDETNIQGVPPSPISKPKSRSPSIDTPGSTRLDAQPSPALDVITEEYQEEDSYFGGLSSPSQKLQEVEETRLTEEMDLLGEAEEPTDDPKSVLDNLKKIESATADPDNTTVKQEHVKPEPEADENIPVEGTDVAEDHNMSNDINDPLKDNTETNESLSHEVIENAEESQSGPTGNEVQTEPEDKVVGEHQHGKLEEVSPPEQLSDTSLLVSNPPEELRGQAEQNKAELSREVGQYHSQDGLMPEVQEERMKDFKEHEVIEGQAEAEKTHEFQQNMELLRAEHEAQQNQPAQTQDVSVQPLDPHSLHSEGQLPEGEDLDNKPKDNVQAHLDIMVKNHDGNLQSVDTVHVVEKPEDTAGPTQTSKSLEPEYSQPESVNGISMGGAIMKDVPAESTIEIRDATQASTTQGSTIEHDILESDAHQSAIALENPHTDLDTTHETDSPDLPAKNDEVPLTAAHDMPGLENQIENASREVEKSAILENPQVVDTAHEADIPISQVKANDEVPLTSEHDILGSEIQESAIPVEHHSTDVKPAHEADPPISQIKVDDPVSEMPVQQAMDAEVDKSATVENPQPEDETTYEPDLLVSQIKVDDEISAVHVKSATSDANDVEEVDSTLTNGVDSAKSTSVDAPSSNGNGSKRSLRKAATANIERPPTPSSIRSPMKAPESENVKKSIWRTILGNWLGGLFASLCGGDRGP